MNHPGRVLSLALVIAALALAAWHWRAEWMPARPPAPSAPEGSPAASTAPVAPAATSGAQPASAVASVPAVRHPIEAAAAIEGPAPAPPTLENALLGLFGREPLATLVRSDDFARRVVATVDNLGREKAPARLWPLHPPAGRFATTRGQSDTEVIAPENFARYARHMALVEQTDLRQVVALYKRFYPQFQQAYEELGYPGRHFNDRVVEVIDLLLATPEPQQGTALSVRLPAIQGPIQPQQPWLLYEFAEPPQRALAAGPQLLLRMGVENQRRVKARLAELHRLLTR